MATSATIAPPDTAPAPGLDEERDRPLTLREARRQFERAWIRAALERHNGRMADTARSLGIQRTNLYRKMRQLQVARATRAATAD